MTINVKINLHHKKTNNTIKYSYYIKCNSYIMLLYSVIIINCNIIIVCN